MTPAPPRRPLTRAQLAVAALVGRGLDYRTCAETLGVSPSTVRVHVHAIAMLLPNPNTLRPSKLVFLWSAERIWEEARKAG